MTRKCGSCGIPAPDGESKFCNRCGSAIVDEPEPQFPVCGTCGAMVADPEAQFCDKCGGPVKKTIACPTCGNPAIDENSKFCTRCGTTFAKPNTCSGCGFTIPDDRAVFCNRCGTPIRGAQPATAPSSVVVSKKRTALPIQEPAAEWDPWTDGSEEFDPRPTAPQEPAYTREPVDEPVYRAPQISMAPKKYAHLPLIADELKGAKNPHTGHGEGPESPSKERPAKKKGVLGFMKR
jgi:rRNA maturation endonuclease Nob1